MSYGVVVWRGHLSYGVLFGGDECPDTPRPTLTTSISEAAISQSN